jgi:hypothetical protein
MVRSRRVVSRPVFTVGLGLVFSLAQAVLLGGWVQGADPAATVKDHLAAGEFGPALAAAAAADAAQRDQLLAQVAAAQAGAGAKRGAIETAADISGDLARKAALGSLAGGDEQPAAQPGGARGGGAFADFDSLIELIKATVNPDSWDDVGGPGAIDEFAGGVYVDAGGLLKKIATRTDGSLIAIRRAASEATSTGDPRKASALRKVSLTRLEREVQLLAAQGRDASEAMQALAGLKRIQYILVYPESGDIVLAGPAGDWRRDAEGRLVAADNGAPVLNLDDLVVTLRNAYQAGGSFLCSIDPRQENLAAAKAVNEKWSAQPLRSATQRTRWLEEVRSAIGRQDIRVEGIDPRTRVGRVLVEADYRMKLVGIGLEEGVPGLTSYLSSIEIGKDGKPPAMNVLRWWFTLNYDALKATGARDAFELKGPGVKVLSENEFLTERGDRVHTGESDVLTRQFADSFTKQFEKLATKYPIYAELRNVFDLSLVASVIQSHDLPGQVGWHMTHFGPQGDYQPLLAAAPTEVESVMNHRIIGGKHVVAVVSGGVRVDARTVANKEAIKTDTYGLMAGERRASTPQQLVRRAWWWD